MLIKSDNNLSCILYFMSVFKSGKPFLEKVELIDRYEGVNVPNEKISLAFRIRYRDPNNTLNDSDINPIHEKIRNALKEKINADLRS